jgi:hypothetical protein
MRPVGGILIGIYADHKGRKAAMLLIIILMTVAIAAIGFAPTYAAIGIAAPLIIVLARLLQGFATGGEFATATSFLIEVAPVHRRGYYGSWQMSRAGSSGPDRRTISRASDPKSLAGSARQLGVADSIFAWPHFGSGWSFHPPAYGRNRGIPRSARNQVTATKLHCSFGDRSSGSAGVHGYYHSGNYLVLCCCTCRRSRVCSCISPWIKPSPPKRLASCA